MDGADGARTRRIVEGVVAGIAGYGNSIGIPTVGGEIVFDDVLRRQPAGQRVLPRHRDAPTRSSRAAPRAWAIRVYYVGSKTGRDGIHGATMASAEFDDKSAEKRPAVQVGDPFMEKLLLEACLELMQTDALIGIQDMGAAGLTCSTCEMGARGGAGIEIDVMHVPQRETGMTPYEIMLSESQERMLLVRQEGARGGSRARSSRSGTCTRRTSATSPSDGMMRVKDHGTVVAEIPNTALVDEAPVYDRPTARPAYLDDGAARSTPPHFRPTKPFATALLALLGSPTVASKRWVYRQYDHMVRTNTVVPAGPRRRRRPRQGNRSRAGAVRRRQRTILLSRSAARRDAGRRRGRAERRVRRRRCRSAPPTA